jgi:hypothetical protein
MVMPTVLMTNASGKRAASRWTAPRPVQAADQHRGRKLGERVDGGSMIGSNIGPLRWKPPITAATASMPVSVRM